MNDTLLAILGFGLLMSLIAMVGGLFVFLPEQTLARWLKPIVAFSAGSLLGGAFFHMIPHAMHQEHGPTMLWVVVGFTAFFALDQLLEWHHCHRLPSEHDHIKPLGPLLLAADGVHNLLGGLAIGAIFMVDIRAGIAAWFAAALHEIPQEIGDFGAIVHSGYTQRKALFFNFLSALSFPLGGIVAYGMSQAVDVHFLIALGAGNFLYIAGADLIPEVKRAEGFRETLLRFVFFVAGIAVLFVAHKFHH